MIDMLRSALRPFLLRLTPNQRREAAVVLHQLANEQSALADADERVGHVVRRSQIDQSAAKQRTGRPRGSGARFLRVEVPRKGSIVLHIGRALWQELGEPAYIQIQRIDNRLELRPCGAGDGYRITQPPNGMPRCSFGRETADTLRLLEGRILAHIERGAIISD